MTQLFVISDLHLGGLPGPDGTPGFQMCPSAGQKRLADFIRWISEQRDGGSPHLVVAGDIVDFLAEADAAGSFSSFTADETAAGRKLEHVLDITAVVWSALARFVERGGGLTLLLGNHDLELSLPRTRRMLLDRLGPGRVEFLYDNQALAIGPDRRRFPEEKVGAVRRAIRELLDRHRVLCGFSSLARGSDTLFVEELLARGGRAKVFLPFPAHEFRKTSVETPSDASWAARFEKLLTDRRVTSAVLALEAPPEARRAEAYAGCNLAVQTEAAARAKLLDDRPYLIAVWDGKAGDRPGGTGDAIREWRRSGGSEPEVLDPTKL